MTNGPLAEKRWSAVFGSHLKKQKEFVDFRKQLLSSFNKSTNRGKVNHFFFFCSFFISLILALSRLMLFQKYASKTQHSIRVHTNVLMRFRIKPSKTIELHVHATKGSTSTCTCDILVIVFNLMRFRPSTLIRYERGFVLIHFQERFQIDAFSMKTLGV